MIELSTRTKAEIAACLVFFAIIWQVATPKREPVGTTTIATAAPELKGQGKQEIKPPQVPVYKPDAKPKLQLPPEVQDDPNKYVLASSKLPNDTHGHTVTTVIDQQTGQVQTYDRRDPYPWLAAEQTGSLWLGYGMANGHTVGLLSISEDLLQVKALHAGVNATLDSDGAWFAGAGVGWRW